jgi:hypothetical protein
MRTTQAKGDIALSQAIATFTKHGMDVLLPITESASYDCAVDTIEGIKRVQVKYTSNVNGEVDLRCIHSNSKGYVVKKYIANSYDWLYILRSNGEEYLIKKCLDGRRSIRTTKDFLIMPNE